MAEVNDIAFRILCKKAGAGLVYTGMINPLSQKDYSAELEDKPAIQLFCKDSRGIEEFIKKYNSKASLWDFNLGCPAKTAREHGFGCYLHENLEEIKRILQIIRSSTKKSVTIKLRKSKNTLKIIKLAEKGKYCDAIAIHARTASQGYSGMPDEKFAEQIKKRTSLPIIYSGNVNLQNANELLKKFDYVMIGRAAIGNPNIFAKLTGKKVSFDFFDYLELAKKYKLQWRQIKTQAMNFTKGRENAKSLRERLVHAKTLKEIKIIMKEDS
jgi:tRNA-dihydrouridine synthase